MKTVSIVMTVIAMLCIGCTGATVDDLGHEHEGELLPLSYTLYSDKTELFVEFMPLVVGSKSDFAAHFTILGEQFLPLNEGTVTVSLIIGDAGIRNVADSASTPGIFRLALIPSSAGMGKLVFDIVTQSYTDQIVIENIPVYADEHAALDNQTQETATDEITYLKEQAWKVEFANVAVAVTPFTEIISTSGQILSAPGDEMVVTATSSGIVRFIGNRSIIGSEVSRNTSMFTISGGSLTENNLDARYLEAKANYEKTKADYERAKALVIDKIVSEAAYQQSLNAFENAQAIFNSISKNYSSSGQTIITPIGGYVKNILVLDGQYVDAGTPLAVVSMNKKLILRANVSQKYFAKLPTISAANFKPIGTNQVFDTKMMNGKVISYGKSTASNSAFLPINFEIDNIGNLVSGSVAEVFLKSTPIQNALVIPISALMEEQGVLYVYVQTSGERFKKQIISIGASDGENVLVLSGIKAGDRVVSKGAYQIKLSSASGELPDHGHEH